MFMESPTFSGPREHEGRTSTKISLLKSVDKKRHSVELDSAKWSKRNSYGPFLRDKGSHNARRIQRYKDVNGQDIPWGIELCILSCKISLFSFTKSIFSFNLEILAAETK